MTNLAKLLVAGAAIGGLAAPAAAQYYPNQQSYPYQQTYPQQQNFPYQQTYPQQGYGQQGYGYQQGTGNVVTDVIDQLLGNRYNVTDRQAVRQCASAAVAQAQSQYGGYGNRYGRAYDQAYGNRYGNGYQQGYAGAGMRVTSISDVQRGSNGLRVRGTLGSAYGNGYQNGGYAVGNLTFRCNVDYRGAVTNVRVGSNNGYRGY